MALSNSLFETDTETNDGAFKAAMCRLGVWLWLPLVVLSDKVTVADCAAPRDSAPTHPN